MNNIKKQKQTHRYREQTRDYQWEEGLEKGQEVCRKLRGLTTLNKINKIQ